MTVRKCSTCKHYEPAPIWRKGWCRNPLLFSPQQSHLVGEDDLDCDRGMGNYWEPIDGPMMGSTARNTLVTENHTEQPAAIAAASEPVNMASGRSAGFRPSANRTTNDRGGEMSQYPPSGPRNTFDDFDDDDDVAHSGPSSGDSSRPSGGGNFTYYPEERYWTDYLRIAAPVLGVIILLALAWFWLSHLIGGNGPAVNITPSASSNPVLLASPTATTSTGTPAVIATATAPSASGTPGGTTEITNGANVVVANTNGDGVNMRDAASTTGNVVAMLPEGTALTVTGDSVNAEQYTWWPVKDANGQSGYVASNFLKVAP